MVFTFMSGEDRPFRIFAKRIDGKWRRRNVLSTYKTPKCSYRTPVGRAQYRVWTYSTRMAEGGGRGGLRILVTGNGYHCYPLVRQYVLLFSVPSPRMQKA